MLVCVFLKVVECEKLSNNVMKLTLITAGIFRTLNECYFCNITARTAYKSISLNVLKCSLLARWQEIKKDEWIILSEDQTQGWRVQCWIKAADKRRNGSHLMFLCWNLMKWSNCNLHMWPTRPRGGEELRRVFFLLSLASYSDNIWIHFSFFPPEFVLSLFLLRVVTLNSDSRFSSLSVSHSWIRQISVYFIRELKI